MADLPEMSPRDAGPVVLYDAGCGICSRSCHFVARRERSPRMRYLDVRSAQARDLAALQGIDLQSLDSLVLIDGHEAYIGAAAAARMAAEMRFPWSLLRFAGVLPAWLREPAYRLLARNRHRLFGRFACPTPDVAIRQRFQS